MNIYINKYDNPYSGGLIIVAANSVAEAHGLMCNYNEFFQYNNGYKYENWRLVEDLVYNGTEPKVIEEGSYEE